MMTENHLDDGVIQSLLHEEVVDTGARVHLDSCAWCRDRVATARREEHDLFRSLEALDVATPDVRVSDLRARSVKNRSVSWRWAAGFLLVIGLGGVAYAAPGSPLRSVVAKLVEWIRPPRVPGMPAPIPPIGGGVLMEPGTGVVIELRSFQPSDSLVVFLVDEPQIAVRALGGTVTFDSDVARLAISNASGVARIEVAVPRQAPRVEIVSGGRQLYVKVGNAISSLAVDTTGGRHVIIPTSR